MHFLAYVGPVVSVHDVHPTDVLARQLLSQCFSQIATAAHRLMQQGPALQQRLSRLPFIQLHYNSTSTVNASYGRFLYSEVAPRECD